MVAGGYFRGGLSSTEVLDLDTGKIEPAEPMNTSRYLFHIITITTGGVERALALGGYTSSSGKLNSVEQFDPDTRTWKPAPEDLLVKRDWFGAVALPRNLICPA